MSSICPAILAAQADDYRQQIARVEAFAKRLQIDIMDGSLTKARSINLIQAWWPQGTEADIHLMVARPTDYLETLVALRPSLVILHFEAQTDLAADLGYLAQLGIKTGLALLPETKVDQLTGLIDSIDHVLIFASQLGRQGAKADMTQIAKVDQLRQLKPALEIGWDGGANLETLPALVTAGVDVINIGSYLQTAPSPKKAYDLALSLL